MDDGIHDSDEGYPAMKVLDMMMATPGEELVARVPDISPS